MQNELWKKARVIHSLLKQRPVHLCAVYSVTFLKKSKIKFNNSYHFHLSHTNFHDTRNIQAQFDEKYLIKVKSSTMNEYLPESD
uniref:Uncharacterized protein n=1 Tax=Anguilla anguilla TaxID=7936 RepID=A0A0E9XQT0_ANGAN